MTSQTTNKTAGTSEEETSLQGKSSPTTEDTKMEKQARYIKCLEDKISKIRTLLSDSDDADVKQKTELELREKLRVVTSENEQLKADHAKFLTELQVSRRQNESLVRVQESLQDIDDLSRTQQTTIMCLKDELSAVRLLAAETQLRELRELQSLTKETRELKQSLITLIGQQQQLTADEHQHGMYFMPSLTNHLGQLSFASLRGR